MHLLVGLAGSQFHLEGAPRTMAILHHHVHFQIGVVPVVVDGGIAGSGIHAEIAMNQRLEQDAEQLHVGQQALGRGPQGGQAGGVGAFQVARPNAPAASSLQTYSGSPMRGR